MADLRSPSRPLIVQLPADLIAELEELARKKNLSVDDLVREACLAFTEPHLWEQSYKDWLRAHPDERPAEFGIDGDDLAPPHPSENRA